MGETIDADLGVMELKQKLMLSKAYLEDGEFVRDVLAIMIEDRMEKKEDRKKEKKAEEHCLEQKQELELARIEAARWKAEKEARIREAGHKEVKEARLRAKKEARLKAEEEARFKAQEEARLKAQEEAKAVEERKMNEIIALEEETRL
ncbi:hypothetical protein TNCT_515251 [Trichonephila clavata]|uniref:Uncharacterized protein n=1 Tax=Trichonephila clavata TaxID=2740835 RepID=A0A8X6HI83_TRICU|nr:hypothetical protein TNCT_515251 [Trichonephila clavata]